MTKLSISFLLLFAAASIVRAQDVDLPVPHKTGGMPLMEALAKRATSRSFDSRELSNQQLSDLLWAGFGINRADGKRTAPSAHNRQEIDLYILGKHGAYAYEATTHRLLRISSDDLRTLGAKTEAPICVVFVADLGKRKGQTDENKNLATVDSGFISQNIYLYCASESLATGYRIGVADRPTLAQKLNLKPDQEIVAVQPVGYPKP